MAVYTDQIQHTFDLPFTPKRIISLVPSVTELLFDLGLEDSLVGRTKFCVHPKSLVKKVPIVGGTKNFRFDEINKLKPDLIIANKEENYQEGIENLQKKFAVWTGDIITLENSFSMVKEIGKLTKTSTKAEAIIKQTKAIFEATKGRYHGRALYLIWSKPYMAVGKSTYINSVLTHLGFDNVVLQKRYPEIDPYILKDYKPKFLFLSTEPFPFKNHHVSEMQRLFPEAKVQLVDGECFSWYGSRIIHQENYLANFLEE